MGKEPVQLSRRGCLYLCAGAAPLPFLALAHSAQSQTARTIKLVVPSAPGGVTDALARLLGEQIGRTQGVTVVIDNRPGAGEVIGTETAARAAPDGNTLLFAANPFVINPHLRKVSYDPLRSFEPVCQLANAPTLIVVTAGSPYHSLADLLEAARAKPGSLTMASIGPGSPFHLGFEKLKRMAKVDMTFVPYPGNGPSVNALLGEHVTMMFGTYANVAEHLKSGKLRAIAATTPRRIDELPDLPTVAESGFPDYAVPVVRIIRGGKDAEGGGIAARGLADCGAAGARDRAEAPHPGPLSGQALWRRTCGLSSRSIR